MAQYNWDSASKESILKALKLHRPDNPPTSKTSKDGLVSEAKAFLVENPEKIDAFMRKIEEESAKPKRKAKVEEGA